jgi:hypothetical protein
MGFRTKKIALLLLVAMMLGLGSCASQNCSWGSKYGWKCQG